jgi:hypothetical protein
MEVAARGKQAPGPVLRFTSLGTACLQGGTGVITKAYRCFGPPELCQFVLSSEGGFEGSEAPFGRGLHASLAGD